MLFTTVMGSLMAWKLTLYKGVFMECHVTKPIYADSVMDQTFSSQLFQNCGGDLISVYFASFHWKNFIWNSCHFTKCCLSTTTHLNDKSVIILRKHLILKPIEKFQQTTWYNFCLCNMYWFLFQLSKKQKKKDCTFLWNNIHQALDCSVIGSLLD